MLNKINSDLFIYDWNRYLNYEYIVLQCTKYTYVLINNNIKYEIDELNNQYLIIIQYRYVLR